MSEEVTPLEAAVNVHRLIVNYEQEIARLVPLRRQAFRAALAEGLTAAGLARLCGISRARVSVLARWGDPVRKPPTVDHSAPEN